MVEGGAVDWAGHANDPIYMITDFLAFDAAVKKALEKTGRWNRLDDYDLAFHERVRRQFLDLHLVYPTPTIEVPGAAAVAVVHQRIIEGLSTCPFQT